MVAKGLYGSSPGVLPTSADDPEMNPTMNPTTNPTKNPTKIQIYLFGVVCSRARTALRRRASAHYDSQQAHHQRR